MAQDRTPAQSAPELHRRLRIRWPLAYQHRERLLRGRPVQPELVAGRRRPGLSASRFKARAAIPGCPVVSSGWVGSLAELRLGNLLLVEMLMTPEAARAVGQVWLAENGDAPLVVRYYDAEGEPAYAWVEHEEDPVERMRDALRWIARQEPADAVQRHWRNVAAKALGDD